MVIELSHHLFRSAIPVLELIEAHGHEAYFVGGCVRDIILGHEIQDIDIASSATPDEIQSIFHATIDVGKEHGTIIALYKSVPYEITTFRTEGTYTDFRRPDKVEFVRNLEEDTLRRDFTINALAIDRNGNLYDYHQGMSDLKARIIRAVGVPADRFNEDALRMMRAIRFASQLGFTIETQTLQAIQEYAPLIQRISVERIRIELSKFLQGTYLIQALPLLTKTHLIRYLPNFDTISNIEHAIHNLQLFFKPLIEGNHPRCESFCWALLVQAVGITEVKSFLKKWTHSNQTIYQVCSLLEIMRAYELKSIDEWFVYQHEANLLETVAMWQRERLGEYQPDTQQMKENLPIQSRKDLQINGKQLMDACNMQHGSALIGNLLKDIEYKVVTGQLLNEQTDILQYVKDIMK